MKKFHYLIFAVLMICSFTTVQMGGQKAEPLPVGFKPASTNTFVSQYPAVN